jgi:hypothetical protein
MLAALLAVANPARTAGASYPIVDTAQAACYSDTAWMQCSAGSFAGQDAQYAGAQPSYTDNGDGTITDNVTGLMWQQDPGGKMTFKQAVDGADSFSLAGYNDWRLPTIKELYSLILFSGLDPMITSGDRSELVPFINTDYFTFTYGDATGERIIDSQFVSRNVYVGDGFDKETVFGVNFADGRIKGYGTAMFGKGKTFYVLHVRGGHNYGENDFRDNGNGTITDAATGLTWQQADSAKGMNWGQALDYCEDMSLAGHSDWRLPNAKELQSIVDYTRAPSLTGTAAIDPVFRATSFTNEKGERDWGYYWTSTTHASQASGGASAAYISIGRGLGYMRGQWVDVHGAGAQRSDPKSGDPSLFPTGMGPQGDARRITNYARCVRGGSAQPYTGPGEKGYAPSGKPGPPQAGGSHQGPPQGSQQGSQQSPPQGAPPAPPAQAVAACNGLSENAACSFTTPHGKITGTCVSGITTSLACVPASHKPPR